MRLISPCRALTTAALLLVGAGRVGAQVGQVPASARYRDSSAGIDERVRDLLGRMTLD